MHSKDYPIYICLYRYSLTHIWFLCRLVAGLIWLVALATSATLVRWPWMQASISRRCCSAWHSNYPKAPSCLPLLPTTATSKSATYR